MFNKVTEKRNILSAYFVHLFIYFFTPYITKSLVIMERELLSLCFATGSASVTSAEVSLWIMNVELRPIRKEAGLDVHSSEGFQKSKRIFNENNRLHGRGSKWRHNE